MRLLIVTVTLLAFASSRKALAGEAEPFRKVLSSAAHDVGVETWQGDASELTGGKARGSWNVRKYRLHGGKQDGVDVIVVDNGKLQVAVCPTRGMGLLWAKLGDVRLGWDSPVKETVHPKYINLQSRGGLGWLEGFNEFACRCGLEWSGHPGTDEFVNNVGEKAKMDLTLHGKVANLPASEVEVVVQRQAPYRITVRGRVDERMFYGPKLELWTELSTEPGSSAFRISDKLTNRGADEQEFQLLYDVNFGRPLLGPGATMVAAIERITPFNARAAEGIGSHDRYEAPRLGFVEQVYKIKPAADARGRTMAMLRNAAGDRAASLEFDTRELPYLTQWKNTNAEAEGYVTGIEPGTSFPHNRRIERARGRVPKLAAGASRTFTIDFAVHVGAEEVEAAARRVAAIRGDRKPQVDPQPEPID
jgi:hypothetical protein